MNATSDFLTIFGLIAYFRENGLKVSYATIHRRIVEGDYPASKIGNNWCISGSDLASIVEIERAKPRRISKARKSATAQKEKASAPSPNDTDASKQ